MGKVDITNFGGPKKARSAYFVFGDEARGKVMADIKAKCEAEGTKFVISMVATELGRLWKEVSDKSKYEEVAKKEKAQYDIDMEAFKKTDEFAKFNTDKANQNQKKKNKENAKEAKSSGMPGRPLAGYMIYNLEVMPAIIEKMKAEGKKADMSTRAAIVKAQWDALGEAKQNEYKEKSAAAKAQYEIDIKAWNETEAGKKFLANKKKASESAAKAKKDARNTVKEANKAEKRAAKEAAKAEGNATKKRKLNDGEAQETTGSPAESESSPAESESSPAESSDNI